MINVGVETQVFVKMSHTKLATRLWLKDQSN